LHAQLDFPLPQEVSVGLGTALFLGGWCFSPDAPLRRLSLAVNREAQPLLAQGMPRRDVFEAYHATGVAGEEDPLHQSRHSGFWTIAELRPGRETYELALLGELAGTVERGVPLARVRAAPWPPTPSAIAPLASAGVAVPEASDREPLVAIAMATYNPPADLLARQLNSIRAQSHGNWVCLISDDCSDADRFATLRRAVGDDARFVISRSARRLGFYRNFERALSMVPDRARFVAMSDQDDRWYPDKLAILLERIGDARLVYSDARIVSRTGELISGTYWGRRRNNHSDMLSLLVANSVTGAASLFPRELLDRALPFPPEQFRHYHDHWIALVALALGEIEFVPQPLYDYVQHGEASLGHAGANRMVALRSRVGALRRDPRERAKMWRRHYFVDVCRLLQLTTVLSMRCAAAIAPGKRRVLERFAEADRSLTPLLGLGARGARELLGKPETLGAEWMLSYAFAWRRAAAGAARMGRGAPVGATPPSTLMPRPELDLLRGTSAYALAEKIEPLALAVDEQAPQRVNVLIPTIDLAHLFGGYIAKFNLARRLAERGIRTRLVTVDPVGPLPASWRRRLESYSGLDGLLDQVELAFARESPGLEVSREDRFIATTWWTAHIAHHAIGVLHGPRLLYLIQEYEPFTFAMGSHAALARESYAFPHRALFSSELLRDYFRARQIGVYAGGPAAGDAACATFENAITPVEPPGAGELAERTPRRLLFYARPEAHAERNMFELGVLALREAVTRGAFLGSWQLNGIGSLGAGRRVALGDGVSLSLLPRARQRDYAQVLRDHDVGLALMYTPHPSLVPLEMAAAGMLTVTNSFETKTAERMQALSSNLIVADPTVGGVASALQAAAAGVEDAEGRVRGSAVRWSRDWNTSFDDRLMARVLEMLAL